MNPRSFWGSLHFDTPSYTKTSPFKGKTKLAFRASIPGPLSTDYLQKQHSFFACVYRFSTAKKQLSTDPVNEEKKCLVKSGKVKAMLMKNKSDALEK